MNSVKMFGALHYEYEARKMIRVLTSNGFRHADILMFSRTLRYNIDEWKYFIGVLMENGVLSSFDINKVVTEEGVYSLYETLSSCDLIREFDDEATVEIDWFLENFCETSKICRSRKNIHNLWDFLFRRSVKFFKDKTPISNAIKFNQFYDSFEGISETAKAAARECLETAVTNPIDLAIWHTAVYGREDPSEEDYRRMHDTIMPYVDDIMKHLLSDMLPSKNFEKAFFEALP